MNDPVDAASVAAPPAPLSQPEPLVRHFRQIALWPLQLIAEGTGKSRVSRHERVFKSMDRARIWSLVEDEFGTKADFQERHYREFVGFLPHVQRFLYGDACDPVHEGEDTAAPLRIYRRNDIRHVRITLPGVPIPVVCDIAHIDLCFFADIDAVILVCELSAGDLPLSIAQDIMFRFGRAYPPGWSAAGAPVNCPTLVEWLDATGAVLAVSDYADRQRFSTFVGSRRAPCIARHWEFVLAPLLAHAGAAKGPLHYRQIEYYRMPQMAYLTLDDGLDRLSRADWVRLAFAASTGTRDELPYAEGYLDGFERSHIYDRFYFGPRRNGDASNTRMLVSGHAFTIVTAGNAAFDTDAERGLLGQFRHQYFVLFLIAHFHKAALLMLSDRLVAAARKLEGRGQSALVRFRREIFAMQESYLRFTQRYYFSEVSDQTHARELFRMMRAHLDNDALHAEVRSEIMDMVQYLDSATLRRQSGSMHRLTVVTIVGLVGTITTGFLGMNLLSAADAPFVTKIEYFGVVTGVTLVLTLVTVAASRAIATVIDWLAGERDR